MSERQEKTASRVANIPEQEFEAVVESDDPPSVTKLADMGRREYDNPHESEASGVPGRDQVARRGGAFLCFLQ